MPWSLWLQTGGSLALRCASRLAHWHWELWAPQQPQEGEPQTTSNQTDFLFLPNGDADVRRRPQCVNSQPKWLNGTAFLHQSHSVPSILPGCAINKGGGFYIKSPLVTCCDSAVTQTLTVPNNDRIPTYLRSWSALTWKQRSRVCVSDATCGNTEARNYFKMDIEQAHMWPYKDVQNLIIWLQSTKISLFPACRFNKGSKTWACWGSPIIGVEKLILIMWPHSCLVPDIWLLGPVSTDGNLLEPISQIRLK